MELVIAKAWHPEINPWEAEAAPAAAPAGLTFWERKYMLYFGICLVGWLVCWLYINNEPKKLWREKIAWDSRTNRFHSISLFQLNFVHVMCLPGAVNTAEVEKVGAELRALKEKLKQEAQGKWDALQAQFLTQSLCLLGFDISIYIRL